MKYEGAGVGDEDIRREAPQSQRASARIESVFLVVVSENGREGVVRRDTPYGTQPWGTDDPALAPSILALARAASGYEKAYLVRFDRAPESPA